MLKRREEQRERVQKEANKGQWSPLHPCLESQVCVQSPYEMFVFSGGVATMWDVSLCSFAAGRVKVQLHSKVSGYQMDEHITKGTPKSWPGFPFTHMLFGWKELAPFKYFPFVSSAPCTFHASCQSHDGLFMR